MKKQLLELYHSILDKGYAPDSRYATQFSEVVELKEALEASLPQSLHSSFNAYTDAMMKLVEVSSEDAFIAGYRTGARLMLVALSDSKE